MSWQDGGPDHEPLLTTLYHLYIYDLNQTGGNFTLDGSGRWQPDYLDYWLAALKGQSPGAHVGFWLLENQPAGLVLYGDGSFPHKSARADFHLSEFFVPAHLRRGGVGRAMAAHLFTTRPGLWELAVLRDNQAAASFWQRCLTGLGYQVDMEDGEIDRVFRFNTK